MKRRSLKVICFSRTHCVTCRDLDGGRDWRISLSQAYDVPGVDFPCPHLFPWGYKPLGAIEAGFDPEVEKRRLRSGGCCGRPSES